VCCAPGCDASQRVRMCAGSGGWECADNHAVAGVSARDCERREHAAISHPPPTPRSQSLYRYPYCREDGATVWLQYNVTNATGSVHLQSELINAEVPVPLPNITTRLREIDA
jgi:hypothetical protein